MRRLTWTMVDNIQSLSNAMQINQQINVKHSVQ